MKKRLVAIIGGAILLQTLLMGAVGAEDVTVSLSSPVQQTVLNEQTGQTSYQTQEGIHQVITDTTGEKIEHSYIWVEYNGVKVLAIDPPSCM